MMEVNEVSEVKEVNDNRHRAEVVVKISAIGNVVNAKPHFAPLGQRTPLTSITSSKAINSQKQILWQTVKHLEKFEHGS